MNKINTYGFLALYASCFFVILYKALTIPITHDECATTVHYINFSYWEIMMFPDSWPNNHILNTLFVKWLTATFSKEQWIVRIPNLISFWVYAFGVYLFLKHVFKNNSILFLFGGVVFLLNFYLLDFFGLSRGYGMSCAFVMLSASYLIIAFITNKNLFIWLGVIFAIVASYANFTSLVYLVSSCFVFAFYFFRKHNYKIKIFTWDNVFLFLILIAYGALIANPIIKMKQDDQFKYWTSAGFVEETVETTINHFNYGSMYLYEKINLHTMAIILITLIVFIELFWIYRIIKHKSLKEVMSNPVFISNTILLLTAVVSILNCKLTNTPNLNGRTALLFYPLFCLVMCSLLAALNKTHAITQLVFAFFIVWFSKWHFKDTFSFKSAREWWFDENTFQVMQVLKNDAQCKQINLRTNWLFHPSFYFYVYTGKYPDLHLHNYDKEVDVNSDADYYYVLKEDLPKLEAKYSAIASFNNDRFILKRKQ